MRTIILTINITYSYMFQPHRVIFREISYLDIKLLQYS
jgi:hypothetical protein